MLTQTYLKSKGSFVNILCASYGAIMLLIFQSLIYYTFGDLNRYKNIGFENVMNICQNQDNTDLRRIIRLLSL